MDKALCLKLGYVIVTTNTNYVSKEVALICNCFLQIFKCSSASRLRSFRHVGVTELLPILIQLWTGIIKCKIEVKYQSPEHDGGLISIVRVLRVFSKMVPAKSYMINYLQGAYLGHLLRDMLIWIYEPTSSILFSSTEVLWETIGLLKDLTFRSQTDDKRILLHLGDGALFKIISVCCERITILHPRIQEWCTAVIWNLALDSGICRNLLSGNDTDESGENVILGGLLEVLIQYSAESKKSGFPLKIKRNATSAIGNIISDSQNHTTLFQNKTVDASSELLPRFMSLVQNDSDSVIRRRAMRTIRCLAGSIDKGTKVIVQNQNLSSFLVDIISQKTSENDEDMHVQVCQTIITLKETIKVEIWSQLQKCLLERIETATSTKIISAASLCLSECFSKNPSARSLYSFSGNFWKSFERATTANSETHASVSNLLLVVAKIEEQTRNASAQDVNASILTKTPVINTLTTILLEPASMKADARNQALQVVQILAGNEMNKRPLAENDRLLSGLVTLCLTQPDPEIKDSAKKIILQLVPEI